MSNPLLAVRGLEASPPAKILESVVKDCCRLSSASIDALLDGGRCRSNRTDAITSTTLQIRSSDRRGNGAIGS